MDDYDQLPDLDFTAPTEEEPEPSGEYKLTDLLMELDADGS